MHFFLKSKSKQSRGAALIEYGILTGLVSVVAIAAVVNLGTEVNDTYTAIETTLETELENIGGGTGDESTPVDPNAPTGTFTTAATGTDREPDASCAPTAPASYDGDFCVDVGDGTDAQDATAGTTARMRFFMHVDNASAQPLFYTGGSNADLIVVDYSDIYNLDSANVHSGIFDLGPTGGYNEVSFPRFQWADGTGFPSSTHIFLEKCEDGSEYTARMHNQDGGPSEFLTFSGRIDRIAIGGVVIPDEDIPTSPCGGGGGGGDPFGGGF